MNTWSYLIIIALTVTVLTGCFAGPNSRWQENTEIVTPNPSRAGFFSGLWHGFIAIPALLLGIFTKIRIYEGNNTGWWYDFAYLLGIGAFSGGGIHFQGKKKK